MNVVGSGVVKIGVVFYALIFEGTVIVVILTKIGASLNLDWFNT